VDGKINKKLSSVLPDDDVLSQCMHCGMCLTVCPTYELTKLERSSPRGRIRMIKSVARGEMQMSPLFADEMEFCLDCQACETACPAGVKYGIMVEAARSESDNKYYASKVKRRIKFFIFRNILAKQSILRFISRILYVYQNWGIQKFLHKSGLMKLLAPKLAEIDKLSPEVSKKFSYQLIPPVVSPKEKPTYRVAFLRGCLMDVMFAEINADTVEVLKACSCEIITPGGQVCCGSLHAHNGDIETAKKLARKNIDIFLQHEYTYLISNSAGCGAFMKDYGHLLSEDKNYSDRAAAFSAKVKDITEFIAEINPSLNFTTKEETVTYHDACHLAHTQKITSEPRQVLKKIPGLKLVALPESAWCCGSAGIYNITRYNDSMKILERKINNIQSTGAKTVLTGNPGCIQQIKYGAQKIKLDIEVLHPVTLLKRRIPGE
jgi:glycolate oxidase iron-sulfur subunit